jgi:hypothetical protein
MDDLAFLRERIESYAGYTNDEERRLSDEQIRAYVGEALSRLRERLHPAGAAGEALARLLTRCQFVDQRVASVFDVDDVGAGEVALTRAADRDLATLAVDADTIGADALGGYLARIDAALDRRWQLAAGAAQGLEPAPASPKLNRA